MKTPYQQKMDQLGLQEHNLFEIAFNKAVSFTSALSGKYATNSMLDERSFLLRSITRMTCLMRSVYLLFMTNKDRASMMILTRSIIDLNATICFLFQFVKDADERALRLQLFYLDGVRTRLKISDPLKDRDPNYISEEEYNATLAQIANAKQADIKAEEDLIMHIKQSPLYPQMHSSVIENACWRYKRIDRKKSSYSLTELYEIASGDGKMARFEQEYLSHYVHGIAISDFQFPVIQETNPFFALTICCSILNHLDPIFKAWFPDDYDAMEDAFKHQLVEYLLDGLTPEALEAYLKRVDLENENLGGLQS